MRAHTPETGVVAVIVVALWIGPAVMVAPAFSSAAARPFHGGSEPARPFPGAVSIASNAGGTQTLAAVVPSHPEVLGNRRW